MVIVIVILSIVSDTLARIGVLKVVDPDQSEKATTYEDTACYSYDRVIVPKIAQNSNGQLCKIISNIVQLGLSTKLKLWTKDEHFYLIFTTHLKLFEWF